MSEKEPVRERILKRISDNLYLLFQSEADATKYFEAGALAIGICKNDDGEWGYWDYDPKTNRKSWAVVNISEDIEDFRDSHSMELEMDSLYYDAYIELGGEAVEMGLNPGTKEFNDFVSNEMTRRFS